MVYHLLRADRRLGLYQKNLISKPFFFLKKKGFYKSMAFWKNETLKAEKAVRSGDGQVGLEVRVFQSVPALASWRGSPPALV